MPEDSFIPPKISYKLCRFSDNHRNFSRISALGLNGEAGEVADQVKKAIRNDGYISTERRAETLEEISDVL